MKSTDNRRSDSDVQTSIITSSDSGGRRQDSAQANVGRRKVLKTICAGTGAAALAGCSGLGGNGGSGTPTEGSGGGTTVGTATDSLTDVNVVVAVYGVWDNSLQYMFGTEKGFYEEEGLNVTKVDAASGGGDLIRTVASGGDVHMGIPVGALGLYAAFAEGLDVRILANHQNMSRDLIWYTTADSEYSGLDDANGARVAFSNPGSSTHLMAQTALENNNLGDAEVIQTGGPADANAALQSGEVDFAWTAPPFFLSSFEEYGGSDYQLGWRGADVDPFSSLSVRVDFSTNSWLSENPETAKALYRAHKKAADWAYSNLDEAVEIWGNIVDVDDTEFLRNVVETTYPRECLELSAIKGRDAINDFAVEYDFLDSKLSQDELNSLYDTSYLP